MKIKLVIIIFLCSSFIKDNILDKAYLECSYNYYYKTDTLSNLYDKSDIIILQIGKNISKSFSYYSFQSDSIMNLPNGRAIFGKMFIDNYTTGAFPYQRSRWIIYKNYPTGLMTVTDGISVDNFIYKDNLGQQKWVLCDEFKKINEYNCQKAICKYRGRDFIAWFTMELPISEGPWKFSGLPGLILEVYDSKKEYCFEINGIMKINKDIFFNMIKDSKVKYIKTSLEEFTNLNKRALNDINSYNKMSTGIDLETKSVSGNRYNLIEREIK